MVELNDNQQRIVEALKELGATADDKMKTADDVAKKVGLGKNIVANELVNLANMKVVKRTVRHKAAGYFVLPSATPTA